MLNKINQDTLKIAIPKNDRMKENTLDILSDFFPKTFEYFYNPKKYDLTKIIYPTEANVVLIPMREKDIAKAISLRTVEAGIISSIQFVEQGYNLQALRYSSESDCKVVAAMPCGKFFDETLSNSKKLSISTSYPNIALNFASNKGLYGPSFVPTINSYAGDVEMMGALTQSDLVIDVMQTGNSLKKWGYEPVEDIFESRALFVANTNLLKSNSAQANMLREQQAKKEQNFYLNWNDDWGNEDKAKQAFDQQQSEFADYMQNLASFKSLVLPKVSDRWPEYRF